MTETSPHFSLFSEGRSPKHKTALFSRSFGEPNLEMVHTFFDGITKDIKELHTISNLISILDKTEKQGFLNLQYNNRIHDRIGIWIYQDTTLKLNLNTLGFTLNIPHSLTDISFKELHTLLFGQILTLPRFAKIREEDNKKTMFLGSFYLKEDINSEFTIHANRRRINQSNLFTKNKDHVMSWKPKEQDCAFTIDFAPSKQFILEEFQKEINRDRYLTEYSKITLLHSLKEKITPEFITIAVQKRDLLFQDIDNIEDEKTLGKNILHHILQHPEITLNHIEKHKHLSF